MSRNIVSIALLFTLFGVAVLSAQDSGTRIFTNGVTVSLIDNGMTLRFDNENSSRAALYQTVDIVIHYENGSSSLHSFEVRNPNNIAAGVSVFPKNSPHYRPPAKYSTSRLSVRATRIAVPTAAQMTSLRARRDAAAATAASAERSRNDARALNESGNRHFNNRDFDRAIADYTQALRLTPNDAAIIHNRGNAYTGKGDYNRAISDFNEAMRINPNNAATFSSRGFAYMQMRDYNRAIADFNEAIRINSNLADPRYYRAFSYMQLGDFAQARADVNRALRIDSNHQSAQTLSQELTRRGH